MEKLKRVRSGIDLVGTALDIRDIAGLIRRAFGATGITAMTTAVLNWLGENAPTLSLWVFGIGTFLLFLTVFPYLFHLAKTRLGRREPVLPGEQVPDQAQFIPSPNAGTANTDYDQRYADWMTTAIAADEHDLPGCIRVDDPEICWEHLEDGGSAYIEFNFDIWSSSVHFLAISKQVDGHICCLGEKLKGELEHIPEIVEEAKKLDRLGRSRSRRITIRQWLSFTERIEMKIGRGRQVEFLLKKVGIPVVGTLPDGSPGPSCKLPLPDVVCVQVPDYPNARVSDT